MPLKITNKKITRLNLDFDAWKLHGDKQIEIVRFVLKPGEIIASHRNPNTAFFYLLCGKGELILDSGAYSLSDGECLRIEKDLQRSWKNIGDSDLSVLVIKEL